MIHHVVYFQLKPEVDASTVEEFLRASRSLLLRVPEVLTVRSGRNLDPSSQWQLCVVIEVASMEKLRITLDDPFYLKFLDKYIVPHTEDRFAMSFELDPSKNLKYS